MKLRPFVLEFGCLNLVIMHFNWWNWPFVLGPLTAELHSFDYHCISWSATPRRKSPHTSPSSKTASWGSPRTLMEDDLWEGNWRRDNQGLYATLEGQDQSASCTRVGAQSASCLQEETNRRIRIWPGTLYFLILKNLSRILFFVFHESGLFQFILISTFPLLIA